MEWTIEDSCEDWVITPTCPEGSASLAYGVDSGQGSPAEDSASLAGGFGAGEWQGRGKGRRSLFLAVSERGREAQPPSGSNTAAQSSADPTGDAAPQPASQRRETNREYSDAALPAINDGGDESTVPPAAQPTDDRVWCTTHQKWRARKDCYFLGCLELQTPNPLPRL